MRISRLVLASLLIPLTPFVHAAAPTYHVHIDATLGVGATSRSLIVDLDSIEGGGFRGTATVDGAARDALAWDGPIFADLYINDDGSSDHFRGATWPVGVDGTYPLLMHGTDIMREATGTLTVSHTS